MNNASILLVDDDRQVLESMSAWLREQGYQVQTASSLKEVTNLSTAKPMTLSSRTSDYVMATDLILLSHCGKTCPQTFVILVTGYGTAETGVEALRAVPLTCSLSHYWTKSWKWLSIVPCPSEK